MSDTTPSEDDRYLNDRPDPATARRRAALSMLLAAARQDPDADWPAVCRRARYAASRVGLSFTQPDFDDLYARPLAELLDPAAAKAAGPPGPGGIWISGTVTAAHIRALADAAGRVVLVRRRGRFQVVSATVAADRHMEIVGGQDQLRDWAELLRPANASNLTSLPWEACEAYAATLNEALDQEQTHRGVAQTPPAAHELYEPSGKPPPRPAEPGPTAEEYIGLGIAYATAALEYLQTLDGWPGFSRWLAANPDTADGELTEMAQLHGAEVILTALSLRYFGVTAGEVAAELGGQAKAGRIIGRAGRDLTLAETDPGEQPPDLPPGPCICEGRGGHTNPACPWYGTDQDQLYRRP